MWHNLFEENAFLLRIWEGGVKKNFHSFYQKIRRTKKYSKQKQLYFDSEHVEKKFVSIFDFIDLMHKKTLLFTVFFLPHTIFWIKQIKVIPKF